MNSSCQQSGGHFLAFASNSSERDLWSSWIGFYLHTYRNSNLDSIYHQSLYSELSRVTFNRMDFWGLNIELLHQENYFWAHTERHQCLNLTLNQAVCFALLFIIFLLMPTFNLLHLQTQEHFQPRVHGFETGMKLEVVHPIKPSIICPATVTKSLGPYYFAITTDYQEEVPPITFCCHSDSPGIFPAGWCSRHQVDLSVPASK